MHEASNISRAYMASPCLTGLATQRIDNVAAVALQQRGQAHLDGEEPVRLCNYVDVYKNDSLPGLDFMEATAEPTRDQTIPARARRCSGRPRIRKRLDDIAIAALVDDDLREICAGTTCR